MRRSRWLFAAALPLAALSSCLLPSFENVPGASGGAGGLAGSAGQAGEAGSVADAGEAGAAGTGTPVALANDSYSIEQGQTLSISAPGVLENDAGSSLSVTAFDATDTARPRAYDADALSIDESGALTFTPQADFFGAYRVEYSVRDKDGQSATASVTIEVRPVDAKLGTLRDGVGGFVIEGSANDAIGGVISAAGDVNKDGFDDILVGAPQAGSGAGRAYLVYGRAKPANVELQDLPPKSSEKSFCYFEGEAGEGAANSLAAIGDLDHDGYADFAVAASGAANGAVHVVRGGAASGGTALAQLPANRHITITGNATTRIGRLVSRGGDVNGDGVPDLLIAGDSGLRGYLFAVPGSASPQSSSIEAVSGLLQVESDSDNEGLPSSMDVVGNVDGDDRAEVVMGSLASMVMLKGGDTYPANNGGMISTVGNAFGWRQPLAHHVLQPVVVGAGNVDADAQKRDDVVLCEQLDEIACRVVFSPPVSLDAGWQITGFGAMPKLAHGADINGDGASDLFFADASSLYVVFGKRSGHAPIALSALGDAGFRFSAEGAGKVDSVATLGDVNGDGIADYAVGDSSANRVYVVLGGKY